MWCKIAPASSIGCVCSFPTRTNRCGFTICFRILFRFSEQKTRNLTHQINQWNESVQQLMFIEEFNNRRIWSKAAKEKDQEKRHATAPPPRRHPSQTLRTEPHQVTTIQPQKLAKRTSGRSAQPSDRQSTSICSTCTHR